MWGEWSLWIEVLLTPLQQTILSDILAGKSLYEIRRGANLDYPEFRKEFDDYAKANGIPLRGDVKTAVIVHWIKRYRPLKEIWLDGERFK